MKNIGQLMKQAQEMQAKMATMQEELANLTVEGHSGGSMIMAACNDAKAKAEARVSEEMAKITGGLKLPGGMQLPF